VTETALSDKLRGEHAAIRAARRRQRFAQRRTRLLLWSLAWYLGFLVIFLIFIPPESAGRRRCRSVCSARAPTPAMRSG
jgi:hypothetical protein